jgi:hypothetical protein
MIIICLKPSTIVIHYVHADNCPCHIDSLLDFLPNCSIVVLTPSSRGILFCATVLLFLDHANRTHGIFTLRDINTLETTKKNKHIRRVILHAAGFLLVSSSASGLVATVATARVLFLLLGYFTRVEACTTRQRGQEPQTFSR